MSAKKVLALKGVLVINLLLLFFFSFNLFKEYNRNRQLNNEIEKLEVMAAEIEAKNLDILDMAKYLDTDEFLEHEARLKLGLQKPGEESVVVKLPDSMEDRINGVKPTKDLPNYKKWFLYFFSG